MKTLLKIILMILAIMLSACETTTPPFYCFSETFYAKNTLNYDITVQCYFRTLEAGENWCEQEPIAWSEPILLQPGECKMVMDYVQPEYIKIFRASDGELLNDEFGFSPTKRIYGFGQNDAIINSNGADSFGTIIEGEGVLSGESCVCLSSERYLFENVPWNVYPIFIDNLSCDYMPEDNDNKLRKKLYKEQLDGYSVLGCFEMNPNAECFK